MDELYFEEGYVTSSYFVYVANATAGFSPFIAEGYFLNDFFEDRGSIAVLFCDAEIVIGMLLEAQAYLHTESSINATINRLTDTTVVLSSTFTQSAIGTRGKDTDLFAFSDAAIAVSVDRIRDTNINASTVFSVATDFVVSRSADADVDAVLSAIINGLRSRDTITETQAAFSFDLNADQIKGFDSSINSEFAISIDAERLRDSNSSISSSFAQVTLGDRTRFGLGDLSCVITLTATVRQIRDAHLTGTGIAAIQCDAVKTTSAQISLASAFSQQTAGGFTFEYSAVLQSYASVFTSRYLGSDRPKTITGTFDGNSLINSATRNTDLSNLPLADNWYYQTQIQLSASNLFRNFSNKELLYIPLGTRSGSGRYIQITSTYPSGGNVAIIVQGFFAPPQNATGTRNFAIFASQTTVTVGISFTGGQRLALYLPDAGGNMTRVSQIDVQTADWTIDGQQTIRFAGDWPFTLSPSSVHTARTDYAWLTLGNYTNSGDTTYTLPTVANTEDTLFLYEFNGSGVESLTLTQSFASALTSSSTLSSVIGVERQASVSMSSSVSVSAVIGTIEDINLQAFGDAAVAATVTRIKSLESSSGAESSVSADTVKTTDINSNLSSDLNVSVSAERTRDISANLNVDGSVLSVITHLEGTTANLSGRFFTTHFYIEEGYTETGYYQEFETPVSKTASGIAVLEFTAVMAAGIRTDVFVAMTTTSSASVTADAVKTTDAVVLEVSESTLTAQGTRTNGYVADITAVFTVFCNGVTSSEINMVAFTNATLTATPEATKPFDSSLASLFTVYAYTQDSLNSVGEADISSEFSQSVQANYTASAFIATDAIASSLTVAVKEVVTDIVCESNFIITANADRTRSSDIDLASNTNILTVAVKTVSVDQTVSCTASIDAQAIKVISAIIDTQSVASSLTAIAKVAGFFVNADVIATVVVDADVIRSAVVDSIVSSAVTADCDVIKSGQSVQSAITSVSTIIGVIKPFDAVIASAMTFVSVIREIRLDEIEYKIPAEGWEYKIVGENREYDIISETRLRSITSETRERRIDGETRIYIVD